MRQFFCYTKLTTEKARKLAQACFDEIMATRQKLDRRTENEYFTKWNKPNLLEKLFDESDNGFVYVSGEVLKELQ